MRPLFAAAALFVIASTGCTTFLPLQTASTVPEGRWQISAQASVLNWCSLTSSPANCYVRPAGMPTPELRLGARRGLLDGLDLGASVRGQAITGGDGALDLGMLADVKRELWSRKLGEDRRQIVSAALGAGLNGVASAGDAIGQFDAVLPVFFGHQTKGEEYFASVRAVNRVTFGYEAAGTVANVFYFGTSVGLVWRRAGFGIQLSYDAPVILANRGTITLSTGFLSTP